MPKGLWEYLTASGPSYPRWLTRLLRLEQTVSDRGHFLKNTKISETQEFSRPFVQFISNASFVQTLGVEIFCYRGNDVNPEWSDVDPSQSSSKFCLQLKRLSAYWIGIELRQLYLRLWTSSRDISFTYDSSSEPLWRDFLQNGDVRDFTFRANGASGPALVDWRCEYFYLWFSVLKLISASFGRVLSVGKNTKYYPTWRSTLTLQCICRSPAKLIFEAPWYTIFIDILSPPCCSCTAPNICANTQKKFCKDIEYFTKSISPVGLPCVFSTWW